MSLKYFAPEIHTSSAEFMSCFVCLLVYWTSANGAENWSSIGHLISVWCPPSFMHYECNPGILEKRMSAVIMGVSLPLCVSLKKHSLFIPKIPLLLAGGAGGIELIPSALCSCFYPLFSPPLLSLWARGKKEKRRDRGKRWQSLYAGFVYHRNGIIVLSGVPREWKGLYMRLTCAIR